MAGNALKKYTSNQLRRQLQIDENELTPYYRYYLNEITYEDLTDIQKVKLKRYSEIWSQYLMGRTQQMILSKLMNDHNIERRQAQYDLSFSIRLHGPLDQVNRDGRKAASREFFDMIAQLAMKEKQYAIAVMAREKADILSDLHKEEKEGFDPKDFEKPTKVVFNVQVNNNYRGSELNDDSETVALDE